MENKNLQNIFTVDKAMGLIKRFEVAKQKRQQFVSIWQEVSNYILPYRGGFYDVTDTGSIYPFDRNAEIYDDTATNALVKAASAFYSYTANPATQWFNFTLETNSSARNSDFSLRDLLAISSVKSYLEDTAEITAHHINVNAQAAQHACAQEILAFSASAYYIIETLDESILTIQPISIRDLYVLNNVYGGVGEVYRTTLMTNEQVVMQFKETGYVSEELFEAALKDPLKERVLIHAVVPRVLRDPSIPDALNMPFASYWIDYKTKTIVQESGFEEMPYAIGRINVPAGHIFGFSPAMNIRHTVKSLNKLCKQKLSAGDLALNPSMNVPLDTYVNPLSMKPAALNYYEPDMGQKAEPMHTVGNFQINTETIKDAREQVRQGMMIDLIEQSDKDNTYQAMQEQLLQLKLMSPWQGSIERDFLKPSVMRTFGILSRRPGVFPTMPPELQEAFANKKVRLKIAYDSPLAKAQQHFKLSATEGVIAFAAPLAPYGSMDLVDVETTVRLYTELIGAPTKILYSEKKLTEIRKQQAQAQQMQNAQMGQMAQMQQMKDAGAAARDMAQAGATMQGPQAPMNNNSQEQPQGFDLEGLPA